MKKLIIGTVYCRYLKGCYTEIIILEIMSDLLSEFEIFSQISDDLKKSIKYFHVFNSGRSVLFVTIDDCVYGFGANPFGKLGFGHENNILLASEIGELKNQGIIEFHIGAEFVIASSINNKLFAWGRNDHGRLGCPYANNKISKPWSIKIFEKVNIKQIDSYSNSIAIVTEDGKVFAWGDYEDTQCDYNPDHVITPFEIIFPNEVIIESILMAENKSFAISNDGNVYIWGDDDDLPNEFSRQDYQRSSRPRLIQSINKVKYIGIIGLEIYSLTNDNKIFYNKNFDRFDEVLYRIIGHVIERIITFKRHLYGMSESWFIDENNAVYKIHGNDLLLVENSIFSWFVKRLKETFETIELKTINIMNKEDYIGNGGFGIVFKSIRYGREYAIKKINMIKVSRDLMDKNSEINIMWKLSSEYIANLYDFWIDKTNDGDEFLYLQMERCDYNLEKLFHQVK